MTNFLIITAAALTISSAAPQPTYFDKTVFPILLKYEGIKFINDPKDPGGPTKYGITLKTINMYKKCTLNCLKNMTFQDASKFYKENFWHQYGADHIKNKNLAINLLLAQVNLGPYRPSMLLQKVTNDFCHSKLEIDGIIGQKSVKAINNCQYDWPGYTYILYYFYKDNPKIRPVWSWARKGLKRRIFHGVH